MVRCLAENASLCQNCDWNGHGAGSSAADHKRQTINCYSGCPSSSELSKIWSFIMDIPNVAPEPNCEQGISMMSISDRGVSNKDNAAGDNSLLDIASAPVMSDPDTDGKLKSLIGSSSEAGVNLLPLATDQTAGSVESTTTKLPYTPDKDIATLDDAGIDSYFESKEMSAGNSDEQPKPMRPATSNAVSADSGMSIPGAKEQCWRLPRLWGITSASMGGDPPWHPPGPEGSFAGAIRDNAITRYKEKKKRRKFDKKIRYASRKARADVNSRRRRFAQNHATHSIPVGPTFHRPKARGHILLAVSIAQRCSRWASDSFPSRAEPTTRSHRDPSISTTLRFWDAPLPLPLPHQSLLSPTPPKSPPQRRRQTCGGAVKPLPNKLIAIREEGRVSKKPAVLAKPWPSSNTKETLESKQGAAASRVKARCTSPRSRRQWQSIAKVNDSRGVNKVVDELKPKVVLSQTGGAAVARKPTGSSKMRVVPSCYSLTPGASLLGGGNTREAAQAVSPRSGSATAEGGNTLKGEDGVGP
ncbi:hypothetical protein GUJ93_ZPchr0006g41665 [Zizania palustris]|uniref:CCT domain-containing protein n=1 Tax=Zizania palustris TaxID=103762 RepID=A0A8J5W3J5_ZIZPA|nr:hypothetical protein GUJ93_ZPchr0006g41665 [Zizania palustris]